MHQTAQAPPERYRVPVVKQDCDGRVTLTKLTAATIVDIQRRLVPFNCPDTALAAKALDAWRTLFRALNAFGKAHGNALFQNPDAEFVVWELDDLEADEILAEIEELVERIGLARAALPDTAEVNES